jgi:hypothetical protein
MDGGNEQRWVIQFCFKTGLSATQTLILCKKHMGMRLWTNQTFRWYSRFRDGRELVEDDERGGRPKSTRTEVNIATVADLVKNDRRIASRMIAESLNTHKTVVLRILKEDLGSRKLCARFVPQSLTPERREDRATSCKRHYRDGRYRQFFNKIITWDETWCFAYDSEKKRQSCEWVGETSPRPKKLIIFGSQGAVHRQFIPEEKTLNAELYIAVLDRLLKRIQRVCPAVFCYRECFLLR